MTETPNERSESDDFGSDGDSEDWDSAQLSQSDMLLDRGVDDLLDEGYSPPDREPSVHVPTPDEERQGETLDERLAEEEPDVSADELDRGNDDDPEVGDRRAGRLFDESYDGISDVENLMVAGDAGIDGAGASAEEAAVHVINDDDRSADDRGEDEA